MASYVAVDSDGKRTGFNASDDSEARAKIRAELGRTPYERYPDHVDLYRNGVLVDTIHEPLDTGVSYPPYSDEHGRMYRGPVRKVSILWKGDVAEHCPRCGSVQVHRASGEGDWYCTSCGCRFRLDDEPPEGRPLYLVDQEGGYGKVVPYDRVFDGVADVYDDLDPVKTEYPARGYFGPGYGTLEDYEMEDDDAPSAEERSQWNYSMYLTEADYLMDRQLNSLGVGDSYKFPDYPVKVTRVQNARPKDGVYAERRAKVANIFRRDSE